LIFQWALRSIPTMWISLLKKPPYYTHVA